MLFERDSPAKSSPYPCFCPVLSVLRCVHCCLWGLVTHGCGAFIFCNHRSRKTPRRPYRPSLPSLISPSDCSNPLFKNPEQYQQSLQLPQSSTSTRMTPVHLRLQLQQPRTRRSPQVTVVLATTTHTRRYSHSFCYAFSRLILYRATTSLVQRVGLNPRQHIGRTELKNKQAHTCVCACRSSC